MDEKEASKMDERERRWMKDTETHGLNNEGSFFNGASFKDFNCIEKHMGAYSAQLSNTFIWIGCGCAWTSCQNLLKWLIMLFIPSVRLSSANKKHITKLTKTKSSKQAS
jgi:hypothetical protein